MKNLQGQLPIILSILFLGSISAATYQRVQVLHGTTLWAPTLFFAGLYLLWLLLESKVATKEIGQTETRIDKYSLEIYAASRAVVVLTGLLIPSRMGEFGVLHAIGLLLFVAALAFRLTAIRRLGQFYSHRVRVKEGHQIISEGPYNFVRHPAYTGMILSHLGFALFFLNPWTLSLWAIFHVPAVVYRILVEEVALFKIPGYGDYARTRKRLIPFVW